jgi:hypothetical protein
VTRRRLVLLSLALSAFVAAAGYAAAQSLIERMVMPGPVVESHAKFEKECGKCHEAFSSRSQASLCLACHKQIADDRNKRVGYHGRQTAALKEECQHCHTDHKGRDADISSLDRERFDHDLTNYQLVDSHKAVACASCHAAKKPFHKTSVVCFDCHKKDDRHKGQLGEKCDGCHSPTKWRETKKFDHGKTKFPLEGAHKDVACDICHSGQIYKDLRRTCVSCHKLQDVHGGRYGEKCETCHKQVKWKESVFDHEKTKFPLHGAHAKTKCGLCHTGDLYGVKLSIQCISCHKKQDVHSGQLGERCEQCHGDVAWGKGVTFNHNLAKFRLAGKHASVPCEECHRTELYRDTPIACEKCHADVIHQGRLGAIPQCGTCHTPNDWSRWRYDHARQAHFPLTGVHARVKCEACHTTSGASLKLPPACESCHKDSYHQTRLGSPAKCGQCHDASAWSHWRFDHDARTGYALTGAHARIKCESCHAAPNPVSLKAPKDCVSCHRKDDPHLSAFGSACERCHVTASWRQLSIRN